MDGFAEIHPEDRERIRHLFHETVKTGVGKNAEFRFLLKDGTVRYIESQGGVIRDHEGKISNEIVASRDVTKRKLAEASLRASEERFHSVARTANDAIVIADSSGSIVAWNGAAQRMFGYSEKEVLALPLTLLFPEQYDGGRERGLDFASAAGLSRFIAVALELRGRRKDGTEFPLELSLSTWKAGDEAFYSAIFLDITDRKRSQELFEQLSRQNELLLNAAGDGILGVDKEERVTFANPAAARVLGGSVHEFIGQPIHQVLHNLPPDETGRHFSNPRIKAALENGSIRQATDETFVRKSGESFPVEYVITPLHNQKPAAGAVLIFRDITERKQAEERLREQAAMLDSAHDAICLIDIEARIRYWNKGAEALYGWTADEVLGKLADNIVFRKASAQHDAAFRELIEKAKWQGELSHPTKRGREIITDSRWTLLRDPQGGPKSILIINTDITEKKQLETQFLRAQRLESIGRLAGGIAHDFNNILAPICMVIPMLREKLPEDNDRKLLDTVAASAKRGAELVRQVLSFSRGTDGHEGAVNLGHLIAEQARIIHQTFPASIQLHTHIAEGLSTVAGNATQFFQVLMNLCLNARDAMPSGGTLSIAAENVVIDPEYARLHPGATPGRSVLITVSDTGTGIPPKIIKAIFRPFNSTKKVGKGTGLGLSVVQAIVKNHHGHLQVDSQINQGTSFKIYLPASHKEAPPLEAKHLAELPRGHGEWVLVVDNEEMILEITTAVLEHAGYRVLSASDGKEALARYSRYQDKISLVVTDMVMPLVDGTAVIHELRKLNPAVKILAISGMMEDHKVAALISEARVPFLQKPISCEKLLQTIHEVIRVVEPTLPNEELCAA